MVGSPSPHSDSPSVADVAAGGGGISSQKASRSVVIHEHVPKGARSESRRHPAAAAAAGRLTPQNAWSSRAVRHARPRADDLSASSGLENTTAASLNDPTSLFHDPIPVPARSSQPSSEPKAAAARVPGTMSVAAITRAAVGGIVVLAVALALIYFFRIRRRVKAMKRCTDILRPELAPMSPSQSSQLSFDLMVKSDRTLILSPSKRFLPLAAPIAYPPATVDRLRQPLPPPTHLDDHRRPPSYFPTWTRPDLRTPESDAIVTRNVVVAKPHASVRVVVTIV